MVNIFCFDASTVIAHFFYLKRYVSVRLAELAISNKWENDVYGTSIAAYCRVRMFSRDHVSSCSGITKSWAKLPTSETAIGLR